MNVLVIHDRLPIRDEIRSACLAALGEGSTVDIAVDLLEARERLAATFYDLVIIDLTLPVRNGREATIENAEILLEEIFDRDGLNAPADIIGISKDTEALSRISTSVSQHLMTCLSEQEIWRDILGEKLSYLMRVRGARQSVANAGFDLDLVIVTALDKEAAPYESLFSLSDCPDLKGSRTFSFQDAAGYNCTGILYAIGRAGQAPAAAATQTLLTQFRPRLIVMSGFCGGVEERTTLGDLIGFRKIDAWDYGKWVQNEHGKTVFQPRPDTLVAPEGQLFDILRKAEGKFVPDTGTSDSVFATSDGKITSWKVKGGHAGSGSAVVTSDATILSITGRNEDIRAIDMESYGFYHACSHTPVKTPDYMCLKAVADMCNGEKDNSLHKACSLISASFIHEVVRKHFRFRI